MADPRAPVASSETTTAPSSRRSDLVTGGIWLALGAAIIVGSWRMDRLESQGVTWFTAPGLVPGIMGILIALTALGIVLRALRARQSAARIDGHEPEAHRSIPATLLTLVLCIGFAAGVVGRGVPFYVAAAAYLFMHIFLLQLPERRAKNEIARGALVAATIAIVASAAISYVFQEVFLVRLP
ncbi:MAG TPA: tripartite tricarboxylate transporter TctB family protein [Casimicrobiaceae bacterium]|nr:tripartite tricarboxylate transporter TctB family protein [Casimicrobiaceae bacterium]